jgi:hypothetical protein
MHRSNGASSKGDRPSAAYALVHAGTHINKSIWSFDQNSQKIRCERIDGEYARRAALPLNPPLLVITYACVVDHALKRPSLLTPSATLFMPAIVEKSPKTASLAPGAALSALLISSMQDDVMALLDQEVGRHESEAVR